MKVANIEDIKPLSHKTAITVGMFDGVHLGHRHILDALKAQALALGLEPMVVTFDCHPRVVLGLAGNDFRQLMTTQERLHSLQLLGIHSVALIHFTPEVASLSACQFAQRYLVERLNVGALLLGYDNMFGSKANNDFHQLPLLAQQKGFALMSDTALIQGGCEVSSTRIRKALAQGQIEAVNQMLGSTFGVEGQVVHGRHVGLSIGFPTANILPLDPHKAIPADGVYAVQVEIDGLLLPGMANVGPRPTFQVNSSAIEVHLLNFSHDLYGRKLKVWFDHRIRDIVRFDDVDSLVEQIKNDRARVSEYYKQ